MSRINDIRTSIMSAAYDAGYEPYINAEFMMHFDMAMGGMGFWPVYDKVK